MRIAQKLKEAEITEEDSPSLKKCFNDKLNPALGLDMEMKTLMPKSHRVIDLKEKGVYDALQSKSLMFRVCESVDGPMIKEYSFSFSYSDSQSQDVITRTGNKKQGGTFNSTAGITPNQMRSSACKMVPTLVQFKRSLDKMPEKQDNDDADHTQDPVQNERQLARVKDWFNSRHLHTLELTDVLSKSPDISVINQTQENESVAYSDNQQHLYSKPSGLALGSSRAVCTFFLHGRCKFGKQCRFLHQDPSPPPRPPPKKDYDDSFWMKIPDKSKALECLPKETLKRLEDEDSVDISSDIAKRCLDTRRQRFIEDPGRKGPLKLRDRNDFVMMFWVTERKWVNEEGRRKKSNGIIEAMGRIRDQRYHQACWSYAGSDLVAATRVLHGLDQQFKPLCTRYLIQNVDRIKYNRHRRCNTHGCFGCSLDMGLAYIQKFGIPQEEEGYEDFRCTEDRKITSNDDLYKIENFFRYNTLEEALVRLRTHAVGATLYGFHGWDGKGIYRGPVKKGSSIVGLHAVIMCKLRIIDGEAIIICRSSSGEDIGGVQGFKGYIAVAANVMFMIVGKRNTRRNAGHHRCSIKPTHLLCEFYSVGMEYKDPSFDKEDPIERKNNEKFKVDIQEFGWQMPPTIEDQRSRQNPRKRGRHCR